MFEDEKELGTGSAVGDGVGQTPTTESTGDTENRQPAGQSKPINLNDLPEFRAVKSKTQKELATERQQREQLQHQMNLMSQQLEQLQTRDLDEPGKLAFELQKRDRFIQTLQQQLQRQQMDGVKAKALTNIQEKAKARGVTVSLDELMEFEGADDAWDYILDKAVTSGPQRQQQRQEKAEANAVDLGGGSAASSTSELQAKYDRAMKRYDAGAMLEIMQEAANAKIELAI